MSASLICTAMLATLVFIQGLCPVAIKMGLTDRPCHRKQHKSPTPLIGGLSIYLAVGVSLLLNKLAFPHQLAYSLAATLLVAVGLVDDYKNLGVKIRLIAQILAGLIMTEIADIKITHLGNLMFMGDLQLGWFATPFTLFAMVGGINAFNMIDGIDGLAGVLALVSFFTLVIVAWITQDLALLQFCVLFIVTVVVFLAFNLRVFGRTSARIFLGDTGSTFLGYTICWLAIYASQIERPLFAPTTALWVIALPIFDSVCIMLRRISRKRSPFEPDREHLHHIMSITGYSVNQIVKRLACYAGIMATVGVVADLILHLPEAVMFYAFLGLFLCHYWGMNYAWVILKTTRFLRTRRKISEGIDLRRKGERRVDQQFVNEVEQRSGVKRRSSQERRFIPTEKQLENFNGFEEKTTNPDYKVNIKDRITLFWLSLYIGSK